MKLCGRRKVQSRSLSVQICKVRVIKSYLMELMQDYMRRCRTVQQMLAIIIVRKM